MKTQLRKAVISDFEGLIRDIEDTLESDIEDQDLPFNRDILGDVIESLRDLHDLVRDNPPVSETITGLSDRERN